MSAPIGPGWSRGDKSNNFFRTLGKLLRYMGGHRWHILAAVIFSLLASIAGLIAPQYLIQVTDLISDGLTDDGSVNLKKILSISLLISILYILRMIFQTLDHYIVPSVSEYNGNTMRTDMTKKLSKLSLSDLDSMNNGDVMSRFTNDTDSIRSSSAECICYTITTLTMVIGSAIMMFYTSWSLALITIIPILIGFILMRVILKKSIIYFRDQARNLGKMNGIIEETFYGMEVVNSYNNHNETMRKFTSINEGLFKSSFKSRFVTGLIPKIMDFVGNIGYIVVCVMGSLLVVNGYITYGVIVAFIVYVREFTNPLIHLTETIASMQTVAVSSERVFEFMEKEEMDSEEDKIDELKNIKGKVSFKDVCFSYVEGYEVIKNVNIDIDPGQTVAIVGPTGSGKTTLANLLMRFYELDSGSITIDGIDIMDMKREAVHRQFCMVLQDSWIFNGTLKENIIFNTEGVSEEELHSVCKSVGIDEYVSMLPEGYDTYLRDVSMLSSGQRQQIMIARAMLRNAPMLILDEATSSLDTRTEKLIQKSMVKLMENRTSFVIAHRLSTIRNADVIMVIKDGMIEESGTHEELLKKGGFYSELYNSQFENCE